MYVDSLEDIFLKRETYRRVSMQSMVSEISSWNDSLRIGEHLKASLLLLSESLNYPIQQFWSFIENSLERVKPQQYASQSHWKIGICKTILRHFQHQ